MSWYSSGEQSGQTVVSTRIRLARNIKKFPFPSKLNKEQADEIINEVWEALKTSLLSESLTLYRMSEQSTLFKQSLIEKHLISPALAKDNRGAAIISKDENISIMICEEDHLRIQTFASGLNLYQAYDVADKLDNLLSEHLDFAFHEKFGFLTSCPTNVGTGMRASVMLHLPAITLSKNINNILDWSGKMGLTVRGLFGEGSNAQGCLYQLSNQITLGNSEEEILSRIEKASSEIAMWESNISLKLLEGNKVKITDKCMRAYGILKNSYVLSTSEAMQLISDVNLGVNLGIIKDVDISKMRETMFLTMPASLSLEIGENADSTSRDIKRAEKMRMQ